MSRASEEGTSRDSHRSRVQKYIRSSTALLATCILEWSRLRLLAAFTVPQAAPTDRLTDEYNMSARTDLVVDTYGLNVKSEYWGADRDDYRPDSFRCALSILALRLRPATMSREARRRIDPVNHYGDYGSEIHSAYPHGRVVKLAGRQGDLN
ncbi:uncharacterized protein A1O9_12451 [Exophiala aquamarina CBS 119918]|uniref:Uncharacterized protein n=1 Tax=Exophiala aquamarina CBS 119918 TaxID=1182545 RepID=A0A072NUI2_9EURO|nr:uncharacterized protein A1O9_12451 [Exophiala aquamarina CBS 119918]KEF51534.1 hypothetical protein A1O9_12451 [Exophiala aquamarina CBS 119918]